MRTIELVSKRYVSSFNTGGAKPSFLGVGSAMQAYVLAAQIRGFEVPGFEPSETRDYLATERCSLPRVSDDCRRFDLILLSHVVEHTYSPKELLHQLIGALKPGGALIVVTPNCQSLIARTTGRLWPMLKPIDHVSMICATTYSYFDLSKLAKVSHWYSEYPYEFAATLAAVAKATIAAKTPARSESKGELAESLLPPHRRPGIGAHILKALLVVGSFPAWVVASLGSGRACLNTAIVRRHS